MRTTGTKKRKSAKLSRKISREIKARKTKTAVTEAFASRKQVGTLELGRTQSVNNYLIHAEKVCVCVCLLACSLALCVCNVLLQAQDRQFKRLQQLFNMLEDPVEKNEILLEMKAIARRPSLRYRDAEQAVFGSPTASPTASPTVNLVDVSDEAEQPAKKPTKNLIELFDSSESDGASDDSEASYGAAAADPVHEVLGAVYEASGYMVLDHVVSEPTDKEWFQDCIQDLFTLFKTNNCVRIWNNGGRGSKTKDDHKRHMLMFGKFKCQEKFKGSKAAPPSDPITLSRSQKFFAPMFVKMEAKLRSLHLIQPPRNTGEPKILISQPGCTTQRMHYDFGSAAVSALRQSNQLIGVPISALC